MCVCCGGFTLSVALILDVVISINIHFHMNFKGHTLPCVQQSLHAYQQVLVLLTNRHGTGSCKSLCKTNINSNFQLVITGKPYTNWYLHMQCTFMYQLCKCMWNVLKSASISIIFSCMYSRKYLKKYQILLLIKPLTSKYTYSSLR